MKKIFLFVVFSFSFCCFGQLYDKGLEVADLVFERAECPQFVELVFGNNSEIIKLYEKDINKVSKSDVKACYEISVNIDDFINVYYESGSNDIHETVMNYFLDQFYVQLFGSLINGSKNSYILALSSVLQGSSIFDSESLTDNKMYLYIFKNSYPILVSFRKGDDNAVLASAMFIFEDDLINGNEKNVKKTFSLSYMETSIKKIK